MKRNELLVILKDYLFDLVKPSISEYIEVHNQDYFVIDWKRNCCLQTSIVTNMILQEVLLTEKAD